MNDAQPTPYPVILVQSIDSFVGDTMFELVDDSKSIRSDQDLSIEGAAGSTVASNTTSKSSILDLNPID